MKFDKITVDLINKGFHKFKLNLKNYNYLKKTILKSAKLNLKTKKLNLEKIHNFIQIDKLNDFRLKVFQRINADKNFKKNVYLSAQEKIHQCVGSEICNSDANLSIQFPKDQSSLLSMHSDFFSGESIFQVNLWIPFVDVKKTQSMFIIDPKNSIKILKKIKNDKKITFNNIDKNYVNKMRWITLKEGEAILFSPNCLHGNVVNVEKNTRWSINIRYKNIFSPYSEHKNEKKIGTFYKPLKLGSITNFNLHYNFEEIAK